MSGPQVINGDALMGDHVGKPVVELWYAIQPQGDGILRLNEIHVDPYAVGDIWLVRGSQRDLIVDTGSGIVPPAPIIEALSDKPILAVALNCYYDHAGGWHSFTERACHRLDAAALIDPSEESAGLTVPDRRVAGGPAARRIRHRRLPDGRRQADPASRGWRRHRPW
jgi:glyoxylase-like metal-dependent hydrolase (beta-lactamase superfamily II)